MRAQQKEVEETSRKYAEEEEGEVGVKTFFASASIVG